MSKYICLSDTHLGQNGKDGLGYVSILSTMATKNKVATLAEQVKDFANGDKIILIGVGDILDLSMATMRDCLEDLNLLLKELPNVNQFIYTIGNHDTHVWNLSCEDKVLDDMRQGHLPKQGSVYGVDHGTYFHSLSEMMKFYVSSDFIVTTAYPSYTLKFNNTSIFFTHGHLFGDIYTTLSDILKNALTLQNKSFEEKLATVNMPIIEFIYWLLGEMGCGMGVDGLVEAIYSDHDKGNNSLLKKAVNDGIDALMSNGFVKGMPDSWERWLVKKIVNNALDKNAKERKISLTSNNRYEDVENTRQQMIKYRNSVGFIPTSSEIKTVFVSGHTHVPDQFKFADGMESYNLGGWLIEPDHPSPEGAVLFIDTEKNSIEFKKL